jgi:hypothetical protein
MEDPSQRTIHRKNERWTWPTPGKAILPFYGHPQDRNLLKLQDEKRNRPVDSS